MTSQRENSTDLTDCITYISPARLKEIDYTRMRPIGQEEAYSEVQYVGSSTTSELESLREEVDYLRRTVYDLVHIVADRTLYIESCEEKYSED